MGRNSTEILLVGSDRRISEPLREKLVSREYGVRCAQGQEEGLARALEPGVGVVVSQLEDSYFSGLQLLRELHPAKPLLPIILVDRELTMESAIEAKKLGAYKYVAPPYRIVELVELVINLVMTGGDFLTVNEAARPKAVAGLVGEPGVIKSLFARIEMGAESSVPVLVLGATGTGKELIANAVHQCSSRAGERFVAVNCGGIAASLVESELFGHEEGAFTDARRQHIGLFEQADKGTLFLDEIGDLELPLQTRLMRVLQERVIRRVGGRKDIQLDVKIVAATHKNLAKLIKNGEFREDLYHRLRGVVISSPELREHPDSIWPLIQHFLIKHKQDHKIGSMSMEREALAFLEKQAWPGNVRELQHAIYEAALAAAGRPIRLEHVREACSGVQPAGAEVIGAAQSRSRYRELLDKAEAGQIKDARARALADADWALFEEALLRAGGNLVKLARLVGIDRKTARVKLQQYNLRGPRVRGREE